VILGAVLGMLVFLLLQLMLFCMCDHESILFSEDTDDVGDDFVVDEVVVVQR
jgi:hypothetical protein